MNIRLYPSSDENDLIAKSFTELGFFYLKIGNYYESNIYFEKAHEIILTHFETDDERDHLKICISLKNLGIFYMKSSQFNKSFGYFDKG